MLKMPLSRKNRVKDIVNFGKRFYGAPKSTGRGSSPRGFHPMLLRRFTAWADLIRNDSGKVGLGFPQQALTTPLDRFLGVKEALKAFFRG